MKLLSYLSRKQQKKVDVEKICNDIPGGDKNSSVRTEACSYNGAHVSFSLEQTVVHHVPDFRDDDECFRDIWWTMDELNTIRKEADYRVHEYKAKLSEKPSKSQSPKQRQTLQALQLMVSSTENILKSKNKQSEKVYADCLVNAMARAPALRGMESALISACCRDARLYVLQVVKKGKAIKSSSAPAQSAALAQVRARHDATYRVQR